MKKVVISLLIVLLTVFSANAQRAAVLEFKAGVGVSQNDVDGISAIFITYFRPAGYTMVERTQIDRVIDEQGFQRSSLTESQMVRIGQILNVSKIVVGDVNVVMGQYNVDVRVLNVESGTIAATEGATFAGSSYRTSMQSIAEKLASKIAIYVGPSVSASSGSSVPKQRTTVEVIYGYLKVFPNELGTFDAEPVTVIGHINSAAQHGYNTWRIPTNEELSLLRANGYLNANNVYMTQENKRGQVLLVTDKLDATTLNYPNLKLGQLDYLKIRSWIPEERMIAVNGAWADVRRLIERYEKEKNNTPRNVLENWEHEMNSLSQRIHDFIDSGITSVIINSGMIEQIKKIGEEEGYTAIFGSTRCLYENTQIVETFDEKTREQIYQANVSNVIELNIDSLKDLFVNYLNANNITF